MIFMLVKRTKKKKKVIHWKLHNRNLTTHSWHYFRYSLLTLAASDICREHNFLNLLSVHHQNKVNNIIKHNTQIKKKKKEMEKEMKKSTNKRQRQTFNRSKTCSMKQESVWLSDTNHWHFLLVSHIQNLLKIIKTLTRKGFLYIQGVRYNVKIPFR